MTSPRSGARSQPRVLLDMRPLQRPSAGRGVGSYARGLLGGLVEIGFDANLTLLLDVAYDEPPLPPGRYQLAGSRRRYHGRLAAYEEAVAMGADLARIKPDLYHAIDFHLPGRSPSPLVVTLHDLIPWAWGGARMRGERLRYWPARRLIRRAQSVIAVSRATAADASRVAGVEPGRIEVVPEAAAPEFTPRAGAAARVRERWGLEPGFLFFVGALDARKDPGALLQAAEVARLARPELQLAVAGAPGRQAPGQMPGAVMLGRVTDQQLADLYSAAGCLVFPSRYEGFGLPCLEAMACGCPVAAYRNSSVPEVVGDAGALVQDGDAEALGKAAAELCAKPEPWRRAGLERAKTFSWRKTAVETVNVYLSTLR
ncbi:MAG TPA: glycosyltransferase family 1 protein [Candidatus Dormibacteraeota bacterium]|nr:glycosyltransferase family 1 protein [Candidatus Dormibacteraeota bacterium]